MHGPPSVRLFDVHGLVRVRVESRQAALLEQVLHHLAEFESPSRGGEAADVVIRDYAAAPSFGSEDVVSEVYRSSGGLLDLPPYRLRFDLVGEPIAVWCDRFALPLNVLVHLALLRRGWSLLHAGGVELEGRRYLFPALGGVGKTAAVAGLVFAGATLFGDDMTIVGADEVLAYPLAFSVYPYHLPLLRLRDRSIERTFRRTALLERITTWLERWRSRPVKLARLALDSLKVPCVNVPPRRIFGDGYLATRGVVDEVYYLVRGGKPGQEIAVTEIAGSRLAEVCTSVLWYEWQQALPYLHLYTALSSFSLEQVCARTKAVLERLFSARPCFAVTIPASLTPTESQAALMRHLRERVRPVAV